MHMMRFFSFDPLNDVNLLDHLYPNAPFTARQVRQNQGIGSSPDPSV